MNNSENEVNKSVINWYITHYDKFPRNAYFIRNFVNCFLHF